MSETVSKLLDEYVDGAGETARFIGYVDKFFDCLNVKHLSDADRTRKPFRKPYTSENDERFQVKLFFLL